MIRLFVGIPLPVDVRQHLHLLAAGLQGAHWISPENMHLTLRFIGEIEEYQADDIHDTLCAIHEPSFDISLSGIETFGRGHMIHTLWAAISSEPALFHLQDKIESALVRAGLDPERRKYPPHV
ncbi:MAG: RNA 2',3'-cyclic phosphodiesterase, partial [Rhodospirillaceae bacterium]|nr:RNA 2',3'-cyclic phosphodiesterase [Rhodospirillaceae bacterium]